MFYNNKYFILSIILTCLSILHHNNATIYSGWLIVISDNGVKQLHYMFETNAKDDKSVFVKFDCGIFHTLVPRGVILPGLAEVDNLLGVSFHHSRMFSNKKDLPDNLRITVLSRITLMDDATEVYVQSFIQIVRNYFKVRSGTTEIITQEIRTGPIVEATMLYYSFNFDLNTNILIHKNIIIASSGGMSIMFRSTLDRFEQLNDVGAKHYYVKLGGKTSRDILFTTRAYCFNMQKLIRASFLIFIANSKKNVRNGNSSVSDYPCFNGRQIYFNLNKWDTNDICLQEFITVEILNVASYTITANFDFETCVMHLREILSKPTICAKFEICWLNMNTKIFAEPTDKHFYLTGQLYNFAYSEKMYNIIELEEIIRGIVYYLRLPQDYATAISHITAMYVLTFCQMLVESIGVNSKDITFQAFIDYYEYKGVLLDARLMELLPVLQATPFD